MELKSLFITPIQIRTMEEIWIGLVGVGQLPGSAALGDASGAYVTVLALASDRESFESNIRSELVRLGLFAFETEDIERLADRHDAMAGDDDIKELAGRVTPLEPVVFGSFHAYSTPDG